MWEYWRSKLNRTNGPSAGVSRASSTSLVSRLGAGVCAALAACNTAEALRLAALHSRIATIHLQPRLILCLLA